MALAARRGTLQEPAQPRSPQLQFLGLSEPHCPRQSRPAQHKVSPAEEKRLFSLQRLNASIWAQQLGGFFLKASPFKHLKASPGSFPAAAEGL